MSKTGRNILIACLAVAAAGGVAAALLVRSVKTAPDPAADSPADVVKYLASEEFAGLPESRRNEWFDRVSEQYPGRELMRRMRRTDLSDAERTRLRENMGPLMQRQMNRRLDEYFALSPEERTQRLDEIIDRMPHRRPPQEPSSASDSSGSSDSPRRRGPHRWMTPDRMRRRLENTDPEDRAKFVEFMKQLHQRMRERRGR